MPAHVKPVIAVEKDQSGIRCGCGLFKPFGLRGIAQMAMGHRVGRNCVCGIFAEAEKQGDGFVITRTVQGHIFERGMTPVTPPTVQAGESVKKLK